MLTDFPAECLESTNPLFKRGIIARMTSNDTDNITPETPVQSEPQPKTARGIWIWLGILLVLLIGSGGAWLGYRNGIAQRVQQQQDQIIMAATTQYQFALLDMEQGHYSTARQRLEYVINLNPTFPGAAEKLAEAMLQEALLLTPTPVPPTPTPVLTPTPDYRPIDEMYNTAQQQLRNKEWTAAMETASTIRSTDMQYRTVQVDGIYYVALRNLGVQKILNDGDLEGGIYMLTLTERFGPLDRDANGYRTWARYYLTGASFWGVDWKRVIDYFGQFYLIFPGLRDTSGITATERFRIANIRYADKLVLEEKYCDAVPYYQTGLNLSPDPVAQTSLDAAIAACENPSDGENVPENQPSPTAELPPEVTPTLEPTDVVPTEVIDTPTP